MTNIQTRLQYLFTDLGMLDAGHWVPDNDSIEASQDNIERIVEMLQAVDIIPADFVLEHYDPEDDDDE